MKRIVVAGILGGVAMFLGGTFTHVVLPLGELGIGRLADEEPVVSAIKSNVTEPGFYFFPAVPRGASDEQIKQWEQRMRTGPVGLLVYRPEGQAPMEPGQLAGEFFSNVLVALVVACLLAQTRLASYGGRMLFVVGAGLVCWLAISVSQWNWYHFPAAYTLGELAHELTGFAAAGLVLAWRIKPE